MIDDRHLALRELTLPPSVEWAPTGLVWLMARVIAGEGYWLQPNTENRRLSVGDGMIIAHRAEGVIRASQLGELSLQFFTIWPEYLNGLLTVAEWHRLESSPIRHSPHISFFMANGPTSQKFAYVAGLPQDDSLDARCALVQLWYGAIADLLPKTNSLAQSLGDLHDRFRALVGRMTEAEFAKCSAAELAAQLHCSERHLTRLFRLEFRTSLHALQIELRLRRAQQLLKDSTTKIIDVAYESGHHNLSLFNVFFKRRFGLTPTQWRKKHTQKKNKVKILGPLQRIAARAGSYAGTW